MEYHHRMVISFMFRTNIFCLVESSSSKKRGHYLKQVRIFGKADWYVSLLRRGDISTQNGNSLKLVNKFTYLGSSVSSTETDINMRLANVWTTNDRLSVIWKSDLTDKIKCSFFKQQSCRYCCMDAPHGR